MSANQTAWSELGETPEVSQSIASLCCWITRLWSPPYFDMPLSERLHAALSHLEDNPATWCKAHGQKLSSNLMSEFETYPRVSLESQGLSAIATVILGRVSMLRVLNDPRGSAGLSAAYDIVSQLGWSGLAILAADEELSASFDKYPDARAEVESESALLSRDPTSVAFGFDRERTAAAIEKAGLIPSLDACTHPNITNAYISLAFGRVLRNLGKGSSAFIAQCLDTIANPAIVAAACRDYGATDTALLISVLVHSDRVFDETLTWTRNSAAWVCLLELESRLLTRLERERRDDPTASTIWIHAIVSDIATALDARADGPRLQLEWLAHLNWHLAAAATSQLAPGSGKKARLVPIQIILQALVERVKENTWASPGRIWELFGGSAFATAVDLPVWERDIAIVEPPHWPDWLGHNTVVVPAMVASIISRGGLETVEWLGKWIRLVSLKLEGDPSLFLASSTDPSAAAAQLAWPLAHMPDPAAVFHELWGDAAWLRTRARFVDIEHALGVISPLEALIKIGICQLSWAPVLPLRDWSRLASILAECIDEARYLFVNGGLPDWSVLVGSLVGRMAKIGLLEGDMLEKLLARYDGDDDALASAAVNAHANGVGSERICAALEKLGDTGPALAKRWTRWNDHLARNERGQPSEFCKALDRLCNTTQEVRK